MPEPSLYDALNKIRVDALVQAERDRRSTFGGVMNELKEELPPLDVSPEAVATVIRRYEIREQAAEIAALVLPRRI